MRRSSWLLLLAIVVVALGTPFVVTADEQEEARNFAVGLLTALDAANYRTVYRQHAGEFFRKAVPEEAFVSQVSITRTQLGGAPSSRIPIQGSVLDKDPSTGQDGPFYAFRFRTKFPVQDIYEDVILKRENGWKLYGIWVNPAPK